MRTAFLVRLYCEARIEKTLKKFALTPRAAKFLLCKRKDQEIRPKSLRKTIKRLASGEGFNLWITKSRKTLIEY